MLAIFTNEDPILFEWPGSHGAIGLLQKRALRIEDAARPWARREASEGG